MDRVDRSASLFSIHSCRELLAVAASSRNGSGPCPKNRADCILPHGSSENSDRSQLDFSTGSRGVLDKCVSW